MADDKLPDPPENLEGIEDFLEAAEDELPGWGTIRRWYRLLKKQLSKEYRAEIVRLRKSHDVLISTVDIQNQQIKELRLEIHRLEQLLSERNPTETRSEPHDRAVDPRT